MTSGKGYGISKMNCNKFDETAHFHYYAVETLPSSTLTYEVGARTHKTESGEQINEVYSVQAWNARSE